MIKVLHIDNAEVTAQPAGRRILNQLNQLLLHTCLPNSPWRHPFALARLKRNLVAAQAWDASMLTPAEHLVFGHLHAAGTSVEDALQLIHGRVFVTRPATWHAIHNWTSQASDSLALCGWIGLPTDHNPHVILEDLTAELEPSLEDDVYVAASFDLATHEVVPFRSLTRAPLRPGSAHKF